MSYGRLLAKNAVLNLIGQILPLAVAFFAVPVLVRGLGTERFGILTLAWTAIGYFSFFDLGLSRALTQAVSAALGAGRHEELPVLSTGALGAMTGLGVIGGALLAALTPLIVLHALKIPPALQPETLRAFYLLAASLPFVLASAGLRSLLEAHQDFGLATALRIPYAVFNFVGPLAVLPFSHSLVPIVAVLAAGRAATCLAHLAVCMWRYSFMRQRAPMRASVLGPLFRQGSWMSLSGVISPLMVNLDRFLIGALLSVTAVAYYATPYDMLFKLTLIPMALLGVLFPAFAETYHRDPRATAALIERAIRLMIVSMLPATILLVTFAHEGLALWLGNDFAEHSATVVRWLAVGVFINSIGQVPFAAIQAIGRSDLTAKLHLIELPLYTALIFSLTRVLGLEGVAIAWTARIAVDTGALLWIAARRLPEVRAGLQRPLRLFYALLPALAAAAFLRGAALKAAVDGVALVAFAVFAWQRLLQGDERLTIRRWLGFSYSAPAGD